MARVFEPFMLCLVVIVISSRENCMVAAAFGGLGGECAAEAPDARLPDSELEALRQIAITLGAKDLNVTLDPCHAGGKLPLLLDYEVKSLKANNTLFCSRSMDNTTCHVTRIFLKSYSLPGMLPPKLTDLQHIEKLDLTRNFLNGSIPTEWASLKYLNFLSLTANRLSGEIPKELGNVTSLTYLSLEANSFVGTIPDELGELGNLTHLMLSNNQFVGNLPNVLSRLSNLTDFRISDNNFSGTIPDFIGKWSRLTRLEIQASGLEGPIPAAISLLESLEDLRITDMNGTSSSFPHLQKSSNMKNLILRSLNITGPIPPYVWTLLNLKVLDVSFNELQGEIQNTADFTPKYTFLSGNELSGIIPELYINSAKYIDLSYNNFTWASDCYIQSMNLNRYRSSFLNSTLSGLLPCSNRFNCTKTYRSFFVNCGGQNVTSEGKHYEGDSYAGSGGSILYVRENWGFSSTGDIMDDDDLLKNVLNSSSYSKKQSELYSTARLSPLSITYFGFCLENGNYTVWLHFAEIKFADEEAFNSLGRRLFDIYIQGKLLEKDFNIKDKAHGIGKPLLRQYNVNVTDGTLDIRLYWAGKGTTVIPERGNYGALISAVSVCRGPMSDCEVYGHGKDYKVPLIFGVVSCVVILVLSIICWRRYFGDKKAVEKGSFSLRELKAATNSFSLTNKIGEGGFGSVYKGQLSDGTEVAVKMLSSKSKQGNREFVNEIGIISGLRHPNLVRLYGCCTEGNQLMLVYEYMENNSLARALFGWEGSSLRLDWADRRKICIGIARGLAFLHEESPLKIVHRDIKATNVLLDGDLNAKISDFGLAKLNEEEKTHISTRVAGTVGYMAPEYALWGHLTNKADVYSFGVVILETVSGKSNSSYKPNNKCVCLLDWASVAQQRGSMMELVDPILGTEFNREEAERMIKLALLCTNASPSLRPTMSTALSMLEGQTAIEEVISDPGLYGYDLRFKSIRDHYQHMQDSDASGSQSQIRSSYSVPTQDLYPFDPSSISFSTTDAEDSNSVLLHAS